MPSQLSGTWTDRPLPQRGSLLLSSTRIFRRGKACSMSYHNLISCKLVLVSINFELPPGPLTTYQDIFLRCPLSKYNHRYTCSTRWSMIRAKWAFFADQNTQQWRIFCIVFSFFSFLICLFLFFGRRSHITAHYENAREAYWRNIFHMIIVILTNVVVLLIINFILVIFQ